MKSERIRVGVAGTGALGSLHARVLSELPEAELVGVFDSDPARAQEIAKARKVKVFPSLEAMAREIQACVVATPTRHHVEVGSFLLEQGVACLIEKPLASSVEEGRQLVDLAAARRLPLMVGHVERFNPAVQALLQNVRNPRFLQAQRVSPFSFRSSDVGVVLDMMIHDLDLVLHLVDSPLAAVHAVGVAVVGDHEDIADARLMFENGAVANVTASRVALKTERKLRLFAKDTYVTLDFKEKSGRIIRPAPKIREAIAEGRLDLGKLSPLDIMLKRMVKSETLQVTSGEEPLRGENREFLAAVREHREPLVSGRHGLLAMEVAERVVASIRENLAKSGET